MILKAKLLVFIMGLLSINCIRSSTKKHFLKKSTNNIYSLVALFLCVLIIGYFVIFQLPNNLFSFDTLGYYLYLPTAFKFKDVMIHNYDSLNSILKEYHTSEGFYQAFKLGNGNWVMKYPMGLSILYFPFYMIGDLIAHITKSPTDGFSRPYQLSVLFGCYFYTVIGLIAIRKVLLTFFTDTIVAFVLILTVFGTNYFFLVSLHGQSAMPHNLIFSLHALTMLFTINWYRTKKLKYIISLGFVIGLTAISRPTEILIVLFPLFYNVHNIKTFKEKIVLLFEHKQHVILLSSIIFVIVSYQLFYWKLVTGTFLFDSYSSNPGEGFRFSHPYILEFLFSFRKGWFIYTPMMVFAVFGFVVMYKKNKLIFWPVLLYFLLSLYVISSWSCWWYGTSFSSRAIVSAYAILIIPFGYFVSSIIKSKMRFVFLPLFFVLLCFNLFQSWQTAKGILNGSTMTRAYYKSVFLQTKQATSEQKQLLLLDRYSVTTDDFNVADLSKYKLIFSKEDNFMKNPDNKPNYTDSLAYSKPYSLLTNKTFPFGPPISLTYNTITEKSYLWLRGSVNFFTNQNPMDIDAGLVIVMKHGDKSYKFKLFDIRKSNFKSGEWNHLEFYYLTPDFYDRNDKIETFFWNLSDKDVYIDDMKIEFLEPLIDESVF